ncbi:Fic family protein [Aquamicrobium zhengzhouense]|uniref:Fic family protein n=1 Tax=Aquamicrobium zhengzhouense TaxID=2781738 RepID=A0ABS0SET2_9HYPH|nr:Fic family protein [Aquamicrobium zhengzhouense]MBI1621808.1 Fic family protein [Aquamicrobium zhengzhouense]
MRPNELLATSLNELHGITEKGTRSVIRSSALSRVHRERLTKAGFVEEIMRGWLAVNSRPSDRRRVDAAWSTVYWEFVREYLTDRFGQDWCLSAESSVALWAENWSIAKQVIVRSPAANNQLVELPGNTSLYLLRVSDVDDAVEHGGLRVMTKEAAVVHSAKVNWVAAPTDFIAVIGSMRGTAPLLRILLGNGMSTVAGRIAGALRHLGRVRDADEVLSTMEAAGYSVFEENPFDDRAHAQLDNRKAAAPAAIRIKNMWARMAPDAVAAINVETRLINDINGYMNEIEERYVADALNSLSIEGYQVSQELIERVQSGAWNPQEHAGDANARNALAAKGYRLAFEEVKADVQKILDGSPSGELLSVRHQDWFRAMFQPSVQAGIIAAHRLAGYRDHNVYLRGSSHVPLPPHVILDAMEALFECIGEEPDPRVKAVVAPFLFTYIHPFPDGNGRCGRFLMNVLLAEAGLPWTVIPLDQRDRYMAALEEASQHEDIRPLATFIGELVNAPPPARASETEWSRKT